MPDTSVPQIRILLSSTRADLDQYREEASRVIKAVAEEKEKWVQLVDLSMERQTQSGEREFAVAVSKRWVNAADWVVLIVGWNYGTISDEPGADGVSVTEWEYRHALELGKKLFVFVAGDPNTADRYRVSKEEREDLKDWIPKQTPQQATKLECFKRELCKSFVARFADLEAFRERLAKTLKNAIDDSMLPDVKPGTPLAELVVAVLPNIRDCLRRVTLIAHFKRTHDYLHELRQHVIRPLREEVLSKWEQEGVLSIARERVIWRLMAKRSEAIGALRLVRAALPPEHHALRECVDAVLKRPAVWSIEAGSPELQPSRETFTEIVDDFAAEVQEAFNEADLSMATEEGNLRERYLALLEDLKRARQQQELGPTDRQRLEDELEKVHANRSRVKESLTTHHRWQEAHNKLNELDSFRGGGDFERKLNHYRGTPVAKLRSLVDEELERAKILEAEAAASQLSVVATPAHPATSHAPSLDRAFVAFVRDVRQLGVALENLRQDDGSYAFDEVRQFFDDAFYYVDKRTLTEVERADERVRALEDWLNQLAAAQQKTA